jgi:hypothetical protein
VCSARLAFFPAAAAAPCRSGALLVGRLEAGSALRWPSADDTLR